MQLVLPVLATSALGVALFVPLRDDRLGRRATLPTGSAPLKPDFAALLNVRSEEPEACETIDSSDTRCAASVPTPASAADSLLVSQTASTLEPTSASISEEASASNTASVSNPASPSTSATGTATSGSSAPTHETSGELAQECARIDAAYGAVGTAPKSVHDVAAPQPSAVQGDLQSRVARRPGAFPFLVAMCQRLFAQPRVSAPTAASASDEIVTERSFARELASLLGTTPSPEAHPTVAAISSGTSRAESAPEGTAQTQPPTTAESNDDGTAMAEAIVVQPVRPPVDRIVPITRLPLRTQSRELTWYDSLASVTPRSVEERYRLLERLAEGPDRPDIGVLTEAYHQEDARGRVLAMRALAAHHAIEATGTFLDAMRTGTDEERVLAVDVLAGTNARDVLPAAFDDRVDAIAARAALAFVGTNIRQDYVRALEPYLDVARIEAILALLAGVVE